MLVSAVAFMALPFLTPFNGSLTRLAERLNLGAFIDDLAAPILVRVVSVILGALGVPTACSHSCLYLTGWMPLRIYIGWQGFILLALTFATGLRGSYTWRSKLLTVLLGIEGAFLVNVLRLLIPYLLVYHFGCVPAIVFHDYLGIVLNVIWLAAFWHLVFGSILVRAASSSSLLRGSTGHGGAEKQPSDDFETG